MKNDAYNTNTNGLCYLTFLLMIFMIIYFSLNIFLFILYSLSRDKITYSKNDNIKSHLSWRDLYPQVSFDFCVINLDIS